jgi:hypothetical protein
MVIKNKKFKKGDKISIKKRFEEMQELQKPFIEKYHKPVLVHATPNTQLFKKILKEEKLKIPNVKNSSIKHSYIERMLGIYPCIFLSLGFAYASSYDFKYSFIFDLDYLKKTDYYKNSISYQAYKAVVQYWDKNNPDYLEKLANKNKTCHAVIDKFYNIEYLGKKRVLFDFWKVEKETFDLINEYPKKKELLKLIDKIVNKKYAKFPKSKRIAMRDCFDDAVPEIIVKHDISLSNDKLFLGFYIRGNISKDIKSALLKQYKDKVLFGGKKITSIAELDK